MERKSRDGRREFSARLRIHRLGVDNIYARFFQPFVSSFSRVLPSATRQSDGTPSDSPLPIFAYSTVEISRRSLLFPPSSTIVSSVIALKIKVHAANNAGKIEKLLSKIGWNETRLASARHGRGRYLCPVEFLNDGPGQPSDQPFETRCKHPPLALRHRVPRILSFFHIRRNRRVAEFGSRLAVPSFSRANKDLDVRSTSIRRGTSYRMTLSISKPIGRANLL